jgi:PBS lyase HEAT-like repeat
MKLDRVKPLYSFLSILWVCLFLLIACSPSTPNTPGPSSTQGVTTRQVAPKPKPHPWEIQGILAALEDADPVIRSMAFDHLITYDLADIPHSEQIAQKAIQRLRAKENPALQRPNKFETPETEERASAAQALGHLGKVALPYMADLGKLVQQPQTQPLVRAYAAQALGHFGDAAKPYAPALLSLARSLDVNSILSNAAIDALAKIDSPTNPQAQHLLAMGQDPKLDASLQNEALKALGEAQTAANYVAALGKIITDPRNYPYPACGAATALGQLGPAAQPQHAKLWQLFQNHQLESATRNCVADALGNLKSLTANYIPQLLGMIKNEQFLPDQRRLAAQILGRLGTETQPYIPALIQFLRQKQSSAVTQIEVAYALANLGTLTQPFFPDLLALVNDRGLDVGLRAATVMTLGPSDTAIKALITLLQDASTAALVKDAAAIGLERADTAIQPYAKKVIAIAKQQGLNPEAPRVPLAYVSAQRTWEWGDYGLAHLGKATQAYLPDLLEIIRNKTYRLGVRLAAAEAIINLGPTGKGHIQAAVSVLPDLMPCSFDDRSPFAHNLPRSLSNIGPITAENLKPLFEAITPQACPLTRQTLRFLLYLYGHSGTSTNPSQFRNRGSGEYCEQLWSDVVQEKEFQLSNREESGIG